MLSGPGPAVSVNVARSTALLVVTLGEVVMFPAAVGRRGASLTGKSKLALPPPGAGFTTATVRFPTFRRKKPGRVACKCVGLTNWLGIAVPLTCTTEALRKLVPVSVKVRGATPLLSTPDLGLMAVSVGTPLFTTRDALPVIWVSLTVRVW